MKTALTIAGSDASGGAGMQADIKTMLANGVYAMSAVTALTAQNTTGVTAIMEVTPDFLRAQLDAVFTDIRPDAVKIGMVSASALIRTIAERLGFYQAEHIVVDPVMVATSGARLISEEAIATLTEALLPLAEVVTPNIPEAEVLAGLAPGSIRTDAEMERAAAVIGRRYGCAVLLKGGHQVNDANDLLWRDGTCEWFYGRRIDNPNTHGTGCTLSSAIASNLAKGYDLKTAVERAKAYISGALSAMLDLGKGRGPMDHGFALHGCHFAATDAATDAAAVETGGRGPASGGAATVGEHASSAAGKEPAAGGAAVGGGVGSALTDAPASGGDKSATNNFSSETGGGPAGGTASCKGGGV